MNWFYSLTEWLFVTLFPARAETIAVLIAEMNDQDLEIEELKKSLELIIERVAADSDANSQHFMDLEKRYQRLTVDSVPPNVVTTNSLVLAEFNNRIIQLEKVVKP